jgi:hypothetical protein
MSGDCEKCHEHCLDCQCGKQKINDEFINEMGRTLLKGINEGFKLKSPKFNENKYASAPIGYDKMIFMDKDKEKEWETMDASVKKHVLANLESTCSMMENKISIQLLCHVINDLGKKIEELQQKLNRNSE